MTTQVKQFLKLFLVVVIALHLLIGAMYLASRLTAREHANGSMEPAAHGQR